MSGEQNIGGWHLGHPKQVITEYGHRISPALEEKLRMVYYHLTLPTLLLFYFCIIKVFVSNLLKEKMDVRRVTEGIRFRLEGVIRIVPSLKAVLTAADITKWGQLSG